MEEEIKTPLEETIEKVGDKIEDIKEDIKEKVEDFKSEEKKAEREEKKEEFKEKAEEKAAEAKEKIAEAINTEDETGEFTKEDIDKNKAMAVVAYLGILVLIPIFAAKESKFARFHSNQGLILFICAIIVTSSVPVIKWFAWILELGIFVLFIIGILNAANGRAKRLPVVGKFDLIK